MEISKFKLPHVPNGGDCDLSVQCCMEPLSSHIYIYMLGKKYKNMKY